MVEAQLQKDITESQSDLLDQLAYTDDDFSSVTEDWQAGEATVFEIAQDTRYEIKGASIDLTGATGGATWTIKMYRAYGAAGTLYRVAGTNVSNVIGVNNPVIELNGWEHYGYTKITAQSDNALDNGKTIKFTWIKRNLE